MVAAFHFVIWCLYSALIGTALVLSYHLWFLSLRKVKLSKNIPGYKPWPIIGNMSLALMNKDPVEFMDFLRQEAKKFGNIARIWIGGQLTVAVMDPRDVEIIVNNHLEKSSQYDLFQPWLGNGLLISQGDTWKNHRKMIVPTFHYSILKSFMPVFNKNAQRLVAALKKETNKEFDVHDHLSSTTVDVLLETAMGVKGTKEEKNSFDYAMAVMGLCNIFHIRHYKLLLHSDFLFKLTKYAKEQAKHLKVIHSLCEKVIQVRKMDYFKRPNDQESSLYKNAVQEAEVDQDAELILNDDSISDQSDDSGQKKRLAFLDFMIEASQIAGNKLSDSEIRDEVNTIMFEGHDTTAAASSFVLCLLGIYQDVQVKVNQELQQVLGDSDRPITFDDVMSMHYLHRVILETLRLYPPVPLIARVLREDVTLASGDYVLPKDTIVGIVTYLIHRNPEQYPNPEVFDPDNFLPERCQNRHYYSFVPFSAGPRSCVGRKYAMLKLKVLLATILRTFKVRSSVSREDFRLQSDIILKRADGFRIKLEERTKA